MEISMAFISAKDLCVLSFFMRKNEHEVEGRASRLSDIIS